MGNMEPRSNSQRRFAVNIQESSYIPDEELAAAVPFEPSYRFKGPKGATLVSCVMELMTQQENRTRQLKAADFETRRLTVEALLANLAVSALHSIKPDRLVALSFHKPRYVEMRLSHTAMTLGRDALLANGLLEYRSGFYQKPAGKDFRECRRASRLRASAALHDLIATFGIDKMCVVNRPRSLVHLNKAMPNAGLEPSDVSESEKLLQRVNARIEAADLAIPDEVWSRTRETFDEDGEDPTRFYQGDQTAKALRRVFTYDWLSGGRLYGGWWQGVTSEDRRLLTIDGEPIVEIDFRNLHPILLYQLTGKRLDIDPYELPPYSRELCKETFQRLLNRTAKHGGVRIKRPGVHRPPDGMAFDQFLKEYRMHLTAVGEYLGIGLGLILQRADSDLALAILDELDRQDVTALPVHDSFIVKARHGEVLATAMRTKFVELHRITPELKWTTPSPHQVGNSRQR